MTRIHSGRFLDPSESVHALVAESGAELVGLAHFLFHRSTTLIEQTEYSQDLFTAGAARLYWHTQAANAAARRLYDRLADPPEFVVYRPQL